MSKSGSATISVNPNRYNIEEEAVISDNLNNSNDINNKDKNRESTINVNPWNKQRHGKTTFSDNPRHTSKANANNWEEDDDYNLSSTDNDAEIEDLKLSKI